MNRSEFLNEMSSSLGKTLKALYGPSLEEKAVRLDHAATNILRINWHYLLEIEGLKGGIEQKFFEGKPIFIISEDGNVLVVSGICPLCSNLLSISPLFATVKCLICETEYSFQTKSGNLEYTELPIKMDKGKIFLGMARS